MAGEIDAVLRQQVVAGHAQAGEGDGARDGAEMLDVRAGEDGGDAGLFERGLRVDGHGCGRQHAGCVPRTA